MDASQAASIELAARLQREARDLSSILLRGSVWAGAAEAATLEQVEEELEVEAEAAVDVDEAVLRMPRGAPASHS